MEITPMIKGGIIPVCLDNEIDYRRESFLRVLSLAKKFDILPVWDSLNEHTVPFAFPFFANKSQSKKFELFLLTQGFFVITWPDLPMPEKKDYPKHYEMVNIVPFLW
jgi:hypothetical protein